MGWLRASVGPRTVLVGLALCLALSVLSWAEPAGAAPATEREEAGPTDPFTAFADFLKKTGPYGISVLAGWWALRKDREKNELVAAHNAQMKAVYEQVVGIVAAQTAATTKMEAAVGALKDAINTLARDDDKDRKS